MPCPIHDWFAAHEDGDFVIPARGHAFSVVPPTDATKNVLYCTKQHCISRLIHDIGGVPSFGAILRGGLPSDEDVKWLASFVGSRRLLFLGDADPPDLLVYSWLRERIDIAYLGLSDQLLTRCIVPMGENLTIPFSQNESSAMGLFSQLFVELQTELGEWCSGLLASGSKIELEALFNYATCKPYEMETALVA